MSLFSKKKVFKDVPVLYYDGDLKEFSTNMPCRIALSDDIFQIKKTNPEVTVNLDIKRILSAEILNEKDYMIKFRGIPAPESKNKIDKVYLVINYTNKDEELKHLDFWYTVFEAPEIRKIIDEIPFGHDSKSYDI